VINGTKDLPLLDEDAINKIGEILTQQADQKLRHIFYDQMQQGRKKLIPLYNFNTGHLPRPMHMLPTYWEESSDIYMKFVDSKREKMSQEELDAFKNSYFKNRFNVYTALVIAYRDPRLPEVCKLDGIDDVLEAERRGLWAALLKHLNFFSAYGPPGPIASLRALIVPGLFVFKRPIGDEVAIAIADQHQRLWMGFGEMTKANAYQQAHGDPSDMRDTTFHKIFLGLIRVSKPYVGQDNPLRAMAKWNQVVQEEAPEPFHANEKILQRGGNVKRLLAYYVKGQDPAIATRLQDPTFGGQTYIKQNGKWVSYSPKGEILEPYLTQMSIARLYQNHPIGTSEAGAMFDTFDRLVVNQKKSDSLKSVVLCVQDVAVKILLPQLNFAYWLFGEEGKAADILLKLRNIIPNPASFGLYNGPHLRSDIQLRLLPSWTDTEFSRLKPLFYNGRVLLGQTIIAIFDNAHTLHSARAAA
jgi:hypothetical protein